ncbi:hypothetical protein GOBAR_DD05573 [Gossypium barbadense]|nr:hypothetical protein GOBAR_DD05573 [Gossypium barbadense]
MHRIEELEEKERVANAIDSANNSIATCNRGKLTCNEEIEEGSDEELLEQRTCYSKAEITHLPIQTVRRSEIGKRCKAEIGSDWRFGSLAPSADVGRERVDWSRFRQGEGK